jgi:hypothetical protein
MSRVRQLLLADHPDKPMSHETTPSPSLQRSHARVTLQLRRPDAGGACRAGHFIERETALIGLALLKKLVHERRRDLGRPPPKPHDLESALLLRNQRTFGPLPHELAHGLAKTHPMPGGVVFRRLHRIIFKQKPSVWHIRITS